MVSRRVCKRRPKTKGGTTTRVCTLETGNRSEFNRRSLKGIFSSLGIAGQTDVCVRWVRRMVYRICIYDYAGVCSLYSGSTVGLQFGGVVVLALQGI